MRKGLLVLMMVAASFAGGAAINGPGLTWAQDRFRAYLATLAPPSPSPSATESQLTTGLVEIEETETVPAAPPPPLVLDPPRSRNDLETGFATPVAPAQTASPAVAAVTRGEPVDALAETPSPSPTPLAPLTPTPDATPLASNSPAPALPSPEDGSGWRDAGDSAAPSRAASSRAATLATGGIPPAIATQEAPHRDPAVTRAGLEQTPAPTPAQPTSASGDNPETWLALRRQMRDLGVRFYWVEGEPDGPVRFRCVIPVAGKAAVAQHFEAEADDVFQAAETALRRVALWRATSSP